MRIMSLLLVSPLPLRLVYQFVCKYRDGIAAEHEHVGTFLRRGSPVLPCCRCVSPSPCGLVPVGRGTSSASAWG